MYNNLDSSQDTTLFSQYPQSQAASLDKSSLPEDTKEDTKPKPQGENGMPESSTTKSDEVTEEGKQDNALENAACEEKSSVPHVAESSASDSESNRDTAEMIPEEPAVGEGLEESTVATASKEPLVGSENTSNVSSSSTSSDVISGTPQPAPN